MTKPVRGARLNQIILDGIGNLHALGSEELLAVFGIIIGTAAVIAILQVGHTARAEAMRQFEALVTDLVSIVLQGDAKKNHYLSGRCSSKSSLSCFRFVNSRPGHNERNTAAFRTCLALCEPRR